VAVSFRNLRICYHLPTRCNPLHPSFPPLAALISIKNIRRGSRFGSRQVVLRLLQRTCTVISADSLPIPTISPQKPDDSTATLSGKESSSRPLPKARSLRIYSVCTSSTDIKARHRNYKRAFCPLASWGKKTARIPGWAAVYKLALCSCRCF